jgi:MoxR-like ATPase
MQCYEGIDEAKALYEWEYAKQLLYTQILKDKISEVTAGAATLSDAVDRITAQDDVFFSNRFILARPLLQAIQSERRPVLLIDEIDKADAEFEAFLLEILSDFQVTVPEIGTIEARHIPIVLLTSNNAREMSDALKRRCLHLYIDFPASDLELEIIRLKVPEAGEALAADIAGLIQSLRKLDMKKKPSISETLDWAKALVIMNASDLGDDLVRNTLSTIAKYEGDLRKTEKELATFLERRKAEQKARAAAAAAASGSSDGGDLLH